MIDSLIFPNSYHTYTLRKEMARELEKSGIPCTVILDSAVGYIMEQVDMVMVGAEGVVESGGIINKVNSLNLHRILRESNFILFFIFVDW